jgi:hypothetical protein
MTGVRDPESGRTFSDDELAWIGAHVTDLRRSVTERRIRNGRERRSLTRSSSCRL